MTETFGLMVAALLVGSAAVTVTIVLLDRFLVKAIHEEKQRIRRSPRLHKAKKGRYEPSAPARRTVYPDGREEVMK